MIAAAVSSIERRVTSMIGQPWRAQSARVWAISAAIACASSGEKQGLPLHVGLHAGDVIRESDNVFGGAVNIAARISAIAAPGEVLVSDVVRALARTSARVTFDDRGEHPLKGIDEPQRVFAVATMV